ncbi:TonB-dependent receptor plug domain-containing protein [Roseateles oligotrophus]|uniref:TonB-dependent receptor n=1 Tax=Roseateles oligotrophus TaxID=1769250 RepID=A0ABT2Y8W8_9BURK|nr:TonB-dependent receptor [Roseateles oligotrophus]MCV2366746.1 TonB-dependent receptor [Roseateles oligotrophus]
MLLRPNLLSASLLLLCMAAPALTQAGDEPAQEMGLEELLRQPLTQVPRDVEVSTSSRFAQSAAQAPSATYVITAADIVRFGLRNMADILQALPGLYTTGDGTFTYVGARGLGRPGDLNSRLLFLVDGMRVNENVFDAGLLGGDFFVDTELIERVEFAPGPGSALYGNNAFLGVVNVMTKRADKLAGAEVHASRDSLGLQQLRASWGHRSEAGWEGWLAASEFRQDRIRLPYETLAEEVDGRRERFWVRSKRLLGNVGAGGWALRGGVSELINGLPELMPNSIPLAFEQASIHSDNSFVALSHERSLTPDWDLFASMSVKRSLYKERYPSNDPETGRQRFYGMTARGRWSNWDLRLSTRRWVAHRLMAGVEVQDDAEQRISLGMEGEPPFAEFFGDNRRVGFFIQDEWTLNDTQRLILGLRRDSSRVAESSVNPRLAWVWSGIPDATLKLMYGSAFRAANLNEFSLNRSWEVAPPKPERVKTLEAAWDQALTPQLQYRLSLYVSRFLDLIDLNQVDLPVYENSAALRNYGAELELERRWDQGARLRAGLSLQRTRDQAGAGLSNSPPALFKLFFSQPILGDSLQASWQVFAMSRRHTAAEDLPGYLLNNVNLLWRPRLDLDLSLGVYNLGNTAYFDRPRIDMPPARQAGRTVQLGLTWRFDS